MPVTFYPGHEKRPTGTIHQYPSEDRPNCPDCGLPVDLPTKVIDGVVYGDPQAKDEDGDIFFGTCTKGHTWAYQPYEDEEDEA